MSLRSDDYWFFYGNSDDLIFFLVVAYGFGRRYFESLDDASRCSKESQNAQQLMVGVRVFLDRPLYPRAEHLRQIVARSPTRRHVVDVGFQPKLGKKRKRDFCTRNYLVYRMTNVHFTP